MLKIHELTAYADEKKILDGFSLHVQKGEIHAIMGQNGAGKSSLASIIAGMPSYTITKGEILYFGKNLLEELPEVRARSGIFLSFQHPVEIPGVQTSELLRASYNEKRKFEGKETMDAFDFSNLLQEKADFLGIKPELLDRSFNVGSSGGEKKMIEMLQLALLEPKLVILDEIDSGLDIDALKKVASSIDSLRTTDQSYIIITHFPRILDFVKPDFVHVLADGKIIKSGTAQLAYDIEKNGYDNFDS